MVPMASSRLPLFALEKKPEPSGSTLGSSPIFSADSTASRSSRLMFVTSGPGMKRPHINSKNGWYPGLISSPSAQRPQQDPRPASDLRTEDEGEERQRQPGPQMRGDAADAAVGGEVEDHRVGHPHPQQSGFADRDPALAVADQQLEVLAAAEDQAA